MRKSITAIAALLLLSACSTPAPAEESAPVESAIVEGGEPMHGPVEELPEAGFSRPAEFGEAVSFPSGLEVTVTSNGSRPVTEADGYEFAPGDVFVNFTVEVVNDTPERLDAGAISPSTAYGEGFQENASLIENSDLVAFAGETVSGDFERMMPGDAADKVRVTISDPSYMAPDAIFEGSMK